LNRTLKGASQQKLNSSNTVGNMITFGKIKRVAFDTVKFCLLIIHYFHRLLKPTMKAIIPVAGAGTKLRPHTYTQPKALIPLAGKTVLSIIIEQIKEAGIEEAIFIVGYLGDKIKDYVEQKHPDLRAHFVHQTERLGLGHAVRMAKSIVKNDEVFVVLGETAFKNQAGAANEESVIVVRTRLSAEEPARISLHQAVQLQVVVAVGRCEANALVREGDLGLLFRIGGGGLVLQLLVALEDAKLLVKLADLLAQRVEVVLAGGLGVEGGRRKTGGRDGGDQRRANGGGNSSHVSCVYCPG